MKIKVTLQQEIEYDSEAYLVAIDDYPRSGLELSPREINIDCLKEKPNYTKSIQAKDLKVGDKMYEIVDPLNGYPSLDGEIIKIESHQD